MIGFVDASPEGRPIPDGSEQTGQARVVPIAWRTEKSPRERAPKADAGGLAVVRIRPRSRPYDLVDATCVSGFDGAAFAGLGAALATGVGICEEFGAGWAEVGFAFPSAGDWSHASATPEPTTQPATAKDSRICLFMAFS
jgi:hypothetical protein